MADQVIEKGRIDKDVMSDDEAMMNLMIVKKTWRSLNNYFPNFLFTVIVFNVYDINILCWLK